MSEIFLIFSSVSTTGILLYGFLIGLKHSTEADHLAAVSTIVAERKSLFSSALIGGFWGLGHTISLFVAGVFVLLLDFQITEQTERLLEFCVGIMLVLLGLNVVRKLLTGGQIHFHTHTHGSRTHSHPHIHGREEKTETASHHGLKFSPRSIAVGMVHGLAGSAALMLLIIPTIDSKIVGLIYIIIFGLGSIGGMMIMSFLLGLPFQFTAKRLNRVNYFLQSLAAVFSIGWGIFIIFEKAFVEGLLS